MLQLLNKKKISNNPKIVGFNHTYFMEAPKKIWHKASAYTTGEEMRDVAAFVQAVATICGYKPEKHDCWASSVKKNSLYSYEVEWKSLA